MPVVTKDTLDVSLEAITTNDTLGLDLETTGLNPYLGSEIFSAIISTNTEDFYFNFNDKEDHLGNIAPEETILPREVLSLLNRAIRGKLIFIHNAKFDCRFLLNTPYFTSVDFKIVCTQALARLINNRLPSYSLANLGALIGFDKDDSVEKYITKHKLFTDIDVGKKKPFRDKHFNLVPFDIISMFGMQDGRVVYEHGNYIYKRLTEMNLEQLNQGLPDLANLLGTEQALTAALLRIEHDGVKIDRDYCNEAYEYHRELYIEAEAKFEALTGMEFVDSRKTLKPAFEKLGLSYGVTAKGNPSFKDDVLPNNTLGNIIREHRNNYKMANTYFRNFLDLADPNDLIHCNLVQGGTATGRFSCKEPNLQNVPKRKQDNAKYPVRKAFIPRSEDYIFVMIDYDQMEYRLLLDIAGEEAVIKKIIEDGLDVHTATANEMDVERFAAKTLNFMLLYGGGAQKLADALDVSLAEAKSKKTRYFTTLKKVKAVVRALIKTVERRGYVVNPFGRRLLNPIEGSYKIPNHYIQGACGDIVKKAMVELHEYLKSFKSRMVLQIHDEILFEVHKDETFIIPNLRAIMIEAYKPNRLPLTAGVDYSPNNNWHEKEPYNG